jgi:hypothetical protein
MTRRISNARWSDHSVALMVRETPEVSGCLATLVFALAAVVILIVAACLIWMAVVMLAVFG